MGGRYVYLIFYGTPIFFGGVCARYDSGIHFRNPLYQRNSSIPRPVLISKPFLPQRPHSWRGRVMSALYSPMPKILVACLPRDLQMPSDGWFFFEIVDIIAVGLYLSILEPSPLMESSR